MSESEYESLPSDESDYESSTPLDTLKPTEANVLNPFFLKDYLSLLRSAKKYITETKESSLKMENYGIGAAGLMYILRALTNSHSRITNLSLQGNNFKYITEDVFEMLAETKLKKVNVSVSKLGNAGFMHLMQVLKRTQITDLNIRKSNLKLNENETSRFVSHLLESRLSHLNIALNNFEPATGALSFIQALPHTSITSLNVSACLQNDVLISLFRSIHLTSITELDVSFNKINDVQLKELCTNLKASKLTKLNLRVNSIQDAGMDFLASGLVGSSVIELDVRSNVFSGNNGFCSCLKKTKIQIINFSNNYISYDKMFSFPDFLKDSSVVSIDINWCQIEDEVGQKFIQSLIFSNLTHLWAAGNQFGALSLMAFVEVVNSTKLTHVDFGDNALPDLEFLDFVDCLRTTQLKSVDISKNFTYSSSLMLIYHLLLGTEGSPIISIDASNCELRPSGIEAIAEYALAETKISHLSLCSNKLREGVVKFAHYLKFSSLTNLDLSDNGIRDEGAEALAKCLKETKITDLDISENLITSCGAAAIAKGLKGSSLLKLNLIQNRIENDGYIALAEGVKGSFITDLDLSDNPGNRILLVEKVLLENRIAKAHLVNLFKKIAPRDIRGRICFDPVGNLDTFFDDVLNFCKTFVEQPAAVCSLGEEETIPFSKTQIIDWILKEFPGQFSVLVASRIDWNISQHLSFLRKVDDLGFTAVVYSLLCYRHNYLIDKDRGILHPYVYKLIFKYKHSMYNSAIHPEAKTKIISFFSEHDEYADGADVIRMLS